GARPPAADVVSEFFPLLEALEVDGLTAPDERVGHAPGGSFQFDVIRASWGQFIGSVPTALRVSIKATVPIISNGQPVANALLNAGHRSLPFSFELGAVWTEKSQTLSISPLSLDMANLFSASAMLAIANVPSSVFVTELSKFNTAAAALEAGPI